MERRPIQVVDPALGFTDSIAAGRGRPVTRLIVLSQSTKAGSSDAPEPLSSNEVDATIALNSVKISG
jgi:hypothetical protein